MGFRIRTWQWVLLAIVAYLIFFIAYIPANYVANIVNERSQGAVRLSNVSGTLFTGNAATLQVNGFRVNNLDWQIKPWALLLLKGSVDIQGGALRDPEQIYIKGNASTSILSPKNFALSSSQLFVPAKSVLSQFSLPVVITASGRFRVDIDELDMTPTCTTLIGNGAWLNAKVDTPAQPVNLGSFEASLNCSEGTLSVEVLPNNSLNLTANITLSPEGGYAVNGQFRPEPDLPPVIGQAADSIFAKNAQGFYLISL